MCGMIRKWKGESREETIAECVRSAQTGWDLERLVRWVVSTAEHSSDTDDLVDVFHRSLTEHMDLFTSDDVQRLSRIHATYGRRLGPDGYATTLVWSTFVKVALEGDATFAPSTTWT